MPDERGIPAIDFSRGAGGAAPRQKAKLKIKRNVRPNAGAREQANHIRAETVRGVLYHGAPLARLLIRLIEGLTPSDVVLLLKEIYLLFNERASELLEQPDVLEGMPIECVDYHSEQHLLMDLQHELNAVQLLDSAREGPAC